MKAKLEESLKIKQICTKIADKLKSCLSLQKRVILAKDEK